MDFKNSLNAGLLAAKKARSNKREIFDVIDQLSDTIKDFSLGKVSLKVTTEVSFSTEGKVGLGLLPGATRRREYEALSLVRKEGQYVEKRIIAEWRLDDSDGYPCVITYNNEDIRCATKDTLAKALNGLMSDAQTGEALLELMEMKEGN